jgi:hypothetical protein
MCAFSARKKAQLERVFSDPEQVRILRKLAFANRNWISASVFRSFIEGKTRVVKADSGERVARWALNRILSVHKKALNAGLISAKHYRLSSSHYEFVGMGGSVQKSILGVGSWSALKFFAFSRSGTREPYPDPAALDSFFRFAKKIGLTEQKLENAVDELVNNLGVLQSNGHIATFDIIGQDNIIIRGIDHKTGKVVFGLTDQVFLPNKSSIEYGYESGRFRKELRPVK